MDDAAKHTVIPEILWLANMSMHRNATLFKAKSLANSHKHQTILPAGVHFLSLNWLSFGKA